MMNKSRYKVIGIMSGTSLDGLDIACCSFSRSDRGWKYAIEHATTVKYPSSWLHRLSQAHTLNGEELMQLDADYGTFIGKSVKAFTEKTGFRAHLVASHGHTVFHQPAKRFTTQIGNGYSIYAACNLPVVSDFRMQDVAFGGEGAPLVPAGDKFLFSEYEVCLNLGGIANLSLDHGRQRIAFDICFCNMALNLLAAEASKKYDKNGMMAADGTIDTKLLKALSKQYTRYRSRRPSLGREIFESDLESLLADKSISLNDRLCTFTESAALEICNAIRAYKKSARVLCTGGGAFNAYLITRMLEHGGDNLTFIIPDDDVVKFKEALVFAFLGVLRVRNEVNCLKSVTHALRDSSSGTVVGL